MRASEERAYLPMLTQVLRGKRAIYYPTKAKKRGAVLFAPGFPKYPSSSPFIDHFLAMGYDVLFPMYSGTFDSAGSFSLSSAVKDIALWYGFLENGVIQEGPKDKRSTANARIVLAGTSFGSLALGLALRKYALRRAKTVILISPLWGMPIFKDDPIARSVADETSALMKFAYPYSYRFRDKTHFFAEMSGTRDVPLLRREPKDPKKRVVIISGKSDRVTPSEMAEALQRSYQGSALYRISGGHSSRIDMKGFIRIVKPLL